MGNLEERIGRAMLQRGNTTSPARIPPGAQVSMHQGTLTRVDTFNGVADFQFPDPDGLIVPSVSYLKHYTDTYQPQVGHVVWGINTDTDFMIFAQHLKLDGRVRM